MASLVDISDKPQLAVRPPQFGLRALLLAVTLCGVLFAIMSVLGGLWSIGLILLLALIAAHVLGNALGTQLRDAAGQSSRPATAERPYDAARPPVPPARRLQEKTGVNRLLLVLAALGAVAGGTVGAVVLVAVLGDDTSVAALALGIVSAAVLGGFFAFLLSSFCFVFSRALGEALGDPAAAGAHKRR